MAGGESRGGERPSVTVRIEIATPPDWIRPGMTGRARIELGTFAEALVVPFSAVVFENDTAQVFQTRLFTTRAVAIEVLAVVDQGVIVDGIGRHTRILRDAGSR